jgi:hypothetical protein
MGPYRKLGILAIVLFAGVAALGQDFEYGTTAELKGLKTYSVETYGEVRWREDMISEISKALPDLKLVDDTLLAEINLAYKGRSRISDIKFGYGTGIVALEAKGKDKTRPRILMNFENERDTLVEKRPHIKFAREFVRAYKKANGLR